MSTLSAVGLPTHKPPNLQLVLQGRGREGKEGGEELRGGGKIGKKRKTIKERWKDGGTENIHSNKSLSIKASTCMKVYLYYPVKSIFLGRARVALLYATAISTAVVE